MDHNQTAFFPMIISFPVVRDLVEQALTTALQLCQSNAQSEKSSLHDKNGTTTNDVNIINAQWYDYNR